MDVNEAIANLHAAQAEALARQSASEPDDEIDDESLDEGVEFVDPSLDHIMHFMDLLDVLSTPAPEPRPVPRP
ncbi:hypothetical protein RIE95_05405 [Acidithiobacillus thiooxidans]|uniref:hypothetical protein n=1 Tax=Acidithiobacillus thiooxidans TaxID=930 RepID=UPI002854AE95|nr:hypothetical protein [Acidithiobacillus thiooxidans]MDR7926431.1 hypothetical protein [Acidithiobacillus thiooxidans]